MNFCFYPFLTLTMLMGSSLEADSILGFSYTSEHGIMVYSRTFGSASQTFYIPTLLSVNDDTDSFPVFDQYNGYILQSAEPERNRFHFSSPDMLNSEQTSPSQRSIGLGRNSLFGRTVGQFMIVPGNNQIVLQPSEPGDFCEDGLMWYTDPSDEDTFGVSVVFSTSAAPPNDPNGFVRCTIRSDRGDIRMSQETINELKVSMGISTATDSSFSCNQTTIFETLPNLVLQIQGSSDGLDQSAIGVELVPRDYVSFNSTTNTCTLKIIADDHCELGTDFLSTVVVFFDAENGQLGFGEPIHVPILGHV